MFFLGISGGVMAGNQDGAACLMRDGKILCAAEEERFCRIKHANGLLPRRAIEWCLKYAGISIAEVDYVAFPGETYTGFHELLENYFVFHFGHSPTIVLVNHHDAHAYSAFPLSGFDRAVVLTMDYSGDRISTQGLLCSKQFGCEKILYKESKPNSLGVFYSILTQYLGFEKDSDEYKVMGLASFGEPCHDMSHLLSISGDSFKLNPEYLRSVAPDKPAPSKQEQLFVDNLGLRRPHRLHSEPILKYHEAVAASGQKALEDVVLHLVKTLIEKAGTRNLCLAGGVALNCVMNQKIHESGLVDNIYVPPHVSDAGMSIGAAIMMALRNGYEIEPLENAFLGPEYSNAEIGKLLKSCQVMNVDPELTSDIAGWTANYIAHGSITGWFQGRMEIGARALGARSILADPRDPDMTNKINATVKFREEFRPFAPSVLWEDASEWFENIVPTPYMTMTFRVKPEKRNLIPAVVHVDGTARVQTVHKESNPLYHNLISEFKKLTGVPMVLNTSMNVMGQPICMTPRNALEVFFSTGMNGLAIGSYYLSK